MQVKRRQFKCFVCFLLVKFVENKAGKKQARISFLCSCHRNENTFHHYRVCVEQLDWQPQILQNDAVTNGPSWELTSEYRPQFTGNIGDSPASSL